MKISARYRLAIAVVVGLAALTLGRANAQQSTATELLSSPFGITSGQVARITAAHVGNEVGGSARNAIILRIELLDTEGEVIAQSDAIQLNPGEMRFWDAPRELLPWGEATGRKQLRARMRFTVTSFDGKEHRVPVVASLEVFDAGTGATAYRFIDRLAVVQITL